MRNVLQRLEQLCGSESRVIAANVVTFINPYSFWLLKKRGVSLEVFDAVGVDAISSLGVVKSVLGWASFRRLSFDFSSIAGDVFSGAERAEKTVFLVGANAAYNFKAVSFLRKEYPSLQVEGQSGYFDSKEMSEKLIRRIIEARVDLVVVGMGAGPQEEFIERLVNSGYKGQAFTCGGFLHQVAKGGKEFYPDILDRMQLRFLVRMVKEPNVIYRYFFIYPMGTLAMVKELKYHKREALKNQV